MWEVLVRLVTKCGVSRPDVNHYFHGNRDYTNTGFSAQGEVDSTNEYEVFIQWSHWTMPLSTGVYIKGDSVRYAAESQYKEPELSSLFISQGTLRLYRPEDHCWVYQYDNSLYWVADQEYYFEPDGSTYIQYQLWTTQPEKLPQNRIDNGWYWDNIGGNFEDYEIRDNFGKYRVMRREIPLQYSITSIETGYYVDGEWKWKGFFRPIYYLSE